MNLRKLVYVMMIITGIMIEKYGLKTNNPNLEMYFGFGMISLGSLNIVLEFFKKSKNK